MLWGVIAFLTYTMQDRDLTTFMISKIFTRFRLLNLLVFTAFSGFYFATANAAVPSPRLKPTQIVTSSHLAPRDARLFRAALNASDQRKWEDVRRLQDQITDRSAQDLLRWISVRRDSKTTFNDITYVVHNLPDWPGMVGIQATGEGMILDTRLSPKRTLDWFRGTEPVSGEGRAALARAYYALGDNANGQKWLRLAWRESRLTRDRQKRLYEEFKNKLSPDDHAARADHLIWEGRSEFDKAQALLTLMPPGQRAVMDARMRIAGNRSGMDAAVERVPAQLRTDPGLLFERARWRRRKQSKEYALPMFQAMTFPPVSETGKSRLWREKKIMAYWAIEQKKFDVAYNLTINHGMTEGTDFAEAEFLAGWLALTKLKQPLIAEGHFKKLKNGVSFPVSLSRAHYWLGRTYEAMNNYQAQVEYAEGMKYTNTFYGFLAGERASGPNSVISLPYENDPTYLRATFEADPRIRALHLLAEAGEERYFMQFSFHLDDVLESKEHLSLLSGLARKYGYMKPSIRAAKQASRFQTMLTESGYPMPNAIMSLPKQFDIPFVLAIARQESEFNYRAVSHARAYGMMQMVNDTARRTARDHRIPYSRERLTTDIEYSANLGALHLHDLLRDYNGSYIMTAVAYNAGPRRVNQWIQRYGDPRKGEIDAVDWLESIPFSETRNYVQRVIENIQVYRARMNGNSAPNRVYRDITVGAF